MLEETILRMRAEFEGRQQLRLRVEYGGSGQLRLRWRMWAKLEDVEEFGQLRMG